MKFKVNPRYQTNDELADDFLNTVKYINTLVAEDKRETPEYDRAREYYVELFNEINLRMTNTMYTWTPEKGWIK